MKEKNKYLKKYRVLILVILLFMFCGEVARSKYKLEVSRYEIVLDGHDVIEGIRILQLTDIHETVFGNNNQNLINEINSKRIV